MDCSEINLQPSMKTFSALSLLLICFVAYAQAAAVDHTWSVTMAEGGSCDDDAIPKNVSAVTYTGTGHSGCIVIGEEIPKDSGAKACILDGHQISTGQSYNKGLLLWRKLRLLRRRQM